MGERVRWRKVRRADGYRVSSDGRARSVDRTLTDGRRAGGLPVTPYPDKDGYPCITINGEEVRLCDLVLETFDRPRPYGQEACHDPLLSEGRQDCRLVALRWDSHRENEKDKRRKDKSRSEFRTCPQDVGTPETCEVQ